MATTCPRCGASLAAGAQFCAACGQSTGPAPPRPAAPPPAAAANRMPIAALVVLLGGLVVLIGAFWLYQSGGLPGMGTATAPVAETGSAPSDPLAPPPVPADPNAAANAAGQAPDAAAMATAGAPAAAVQAPAPGPASPVGDGAAAASAAVVAKPAPPPPPPFEKTYESRKYAAFKIEPDTAIVTVDGEIIGIADEWADTPRTKKYEFEKEGVHYVKLSHRDYKTIWLRFIVSDKADDKTVEVELEMKKADKDDKDEKKDDAKKDEKKKDEKKK